MLAPLLSLKGIRWFSLQLGAARDQVSRYPGITDLAEHLHDFVDTAGAIAALDVVVCVDTAIAHLAAAGLGKPVFVMLPAIPDWRWRLETEDCVWYPNVRLIRQPGAGDWQAVVSRVASILSQKTRGRAH